MAIKFTTSGVVKHGKLSFAPGVAYAFEDPDAEPFFIAAGWAERTKDKPVHTFTLGEIDIDPATVFGGGDKKGQAVLPAKAES